MKQFIILILLCISMTCLGQKKKFYDKSGISVTEAESHYYIFQKESTNSLDTIRSFYTNSDVPRSIEVVNELGVRNGVSIFYRENGSIRKKTFFKNGEIEGDVIAHYPNNKIRSVEFHSRNNYRIINYWDSLGNQIVKDGTGFCHCTFNESDILEIGKIEDGLRDSTWIGLLNNGEKYYEEIYKKGDFVSGISFDQNGQKYEYNQMEEQALPIGGMQSLYTHIGKKLIYPKEARKKRVQGKVFVEFIIEKDGSIQNVTVIKGIGSGCDELAANVVATLPRWNPGRQRGKPVRQKMVLPLSFKLS